MGEACPATVLASVDRFPHQEPRCLGRLFLTLSGSGCSGAGVLFPLSLLRAERPRLDLCHGWGLAGSVTNISCHISRKAAGYPPAACSGPDPGDPSNMEGSVSESDGLASPASTTIGSPVTWATV